MQGILNRRSFFKNSLSVAIGASIAPYVINKNAFGFDTKGLSFWEEYYEGAMKILNGLGDTQVEIIEKEMKTAYERTKKRGAVYSQITAGHFPTPETALDRIGNPGVFAFLERGAEEERYAKLHKNDVIITNTINLNNIPAMKRGIRVVGVTVNYYPFAKTPPKEGYQIEYEGKLLKIEDASSVIIDSQTPWDNGLVHMPQNPDFPVIPSSGLAQAAVYWMCAAEFAGLKGNRGKTPKKWAKDYIDKCIERALMAGKDRPKFIATAKKLADLVFKGAKWYVYGYNHALTYDAWTVANGPMITIPYKVEHSNLNNAHKLKKGDIVLIGAYSSNRPEEMAVARECKRRGAFVIAITPFSTDGDSSGPRLFKEVDVAFNNYSPESWGVVPVKGFKRKACPTTGVIGDLVMWLLVAQWADEMARRGECPYFYKGGFMDGGSEFNKKTKPLYEARGW